MAYQREVETGSYIGQSPCGLTEVKGQALVLPGLRVKVNPRSKTPIRLSSKEKGI